MEEDLLESLERALQAYGEPFETVKSFEYLGRVLTVGDDDWPAVEGNLRKASKSWVWITRILSREGAEPKISGILCKAVVQTVLLFGAETWVLNPRMERALRSFQHRFSQHITGRKPSRRG